MSTSELAMSRRIATARRIKGLMGENDVTQTALAHVLDLTQGTVSKYLSCERPFTADQLYAIAERFDVPVADLLPDPADRDIAEAETRSRCFEDADTVSFAMELASV